MTNSKNRRAAFFDRDNTLIFDPGYIGDPAAVQILPGAAAAISHLRRQGYLVVVITNQSGVARGYYDEAAVRAVNARTAELLLAQDSDATIAAFYYCPHLAGCSCRKPLPGLFLQAARELHLDLPKSVALGDSERDVQAAYAAGCGRALRIGPPPLPSVLEAAHHLHPA